MTNDELKAIRSRLEAAKGNLSRDYRLDVRDADLRALLNEVERLHVVIEQHRGALGYAVPAHILEDFSIRNGLSEAKEKRITALEAENARLQAQVYCPVCKSCGEEGCCAAERCLYPDIKSETVKELKDYVTALESKLTVARTALEFIADIYVDVSKDSVNLIHAQTKASDALKSLEANRD